MDALATLQRLGGGQLLERWHAAIVQTAEQVVESGSAGIVTVRIAISTKEQGNPMVMMDEQISTTPPRRKAKGAMFYCVDGGLYKNDPRQLEMDFRRVEPATPDVREAEPREKVEREIR